MGGADFNRFKRLRNQLVITAENFGSEENLSPVLIPTRIKDIDQQRKFAHKVIDVVDQANRNICVTLLRYNVESQMVFTLKFEFSQGGRRKRCFNKVFM